jgi:integrase
LVGVSLDETSGVLAAKAEANGKLPSACRQCAKTQDSPCLHNNCSHFRQSKCAFACFEVGRRPDDQRDRYLSAEELGRLKQALDEKTYRKGTQAINKTFYRLRLIVLIAVTTGMRASEIFALRRMDVMYDEGLLAVRAKLKGGKMRYVPMLPELAGELRRVPAVIGEDRLFPPKPGATSERQRVEGSFEDLLDRANIQDFRFHDLRHTFASWYMMNGGDLYELAKILGHSNIRMTERYAKLARQHIARTGSTAREIWKLLEVNIARNANAC